jgi:hypothetical protein
MQPFGKAAVDPLAGDGKQPGSDKELEAAAIVSGDPLAWPDHDPYNPVEPLPRER